MSIACHPFIEHQKVALASFHERSLEKGMWFPSQYINALREAKQEKRLQWCIDNRVCEKAYLNRKVFAYLKDEEVKGSLDSCKKKAIERLISSYAPVFWNRQDYSPSEAISHLADQIALIDCVFAKGLTMLRAAQQYLGDEKFDKIFADRLLTIAHLPNLLSLFDVIEISSLEEVREGDWCFVKNVPSYSRRHSMGIAKGWHVLCTGKDRYMGFGLDEGKEKSIEEIADILFEAHRSEPQHFRSYRPEGFGSPLEQTLQWLCEEMVPPAISREAWDKEAKEKFAQTFPSLKIMDNTIYRPRLDVLEELKREEKIEEFERLYRQHCGVRGSEKMHHLISKILTATSKPQIEKAWEDARENLSSREQSF